MKKITKFSILILFIISLISLPVLYYFPNNTLVKSIKYYISPELKQTVKNIVFYIPELNKKLNYLDDKINKLNSELSIAKQENNLFKMDEIIKNEYEIFAHKRKIDDYGIYSFPIPFSNYKASKKAAFYISISENDIYLISGIGQILKINRNNIKSNKIKPSLVENNISILIKDPRHFDINQNTRISGQISIKDSIIINNKLYLSYNKEVKKDCYNTSVIYADLSTKKLFFQDFFTYKECIPREKKEFKNFFWGQQSGGRIIDLNNEKILLTIGEYRSRTLAQKDDSLFGKIIEIDLKTKKSAIFSKGHRNPQGLMYLKSKNKIISTEHGPYGGDEVNVIEKNGNYGWPISSYGRHYDNTFKEEAPLHKSHIKHGFIEPIFHWSKVSSVGVSQIVHLGENQNGLDIVLVGSLRAQKLFFFEINKDFTIANLYKTINISERVRDIVYDKNNNYILLSLENTPKFAVIFKDPPNYF